MDSKESLFLTVSIEPVVVDPEDSSLKSKAISGTEADKQVICRGVQRGTLFDGVSSLPLFAGPNGKNVFARSLQQGRFSPVP